MKTLLDTNVLIDALRGLPAAVSYLEGLGDVETVCSVITVAELWAGAEKGEQSQLEAFLGAFRSQPVDEEIARQAGEFMKTYGKSHGLTMPDALIAATACVISATLVTRNTRHFPMKDLEVQMPYSHSH